MQDGDRGIVVGKSWPRPATPCALVPRWEGEFRDHSDWVSFATARLTVATDSNGRPLQAICVDTLGRRCNNGRDMARARDEGTFPVRYFWDCQPTDASTAKLVEALEIAREYVWKATIAPGSSLGDVLALGKINAALSEYRGEEGK